jgi:hypothetical protein
MSDLAIITPSRGVVELEYDEPTAIATEEEEEEEMKRKSDEEQQTALLLEYINNLSCERSCPEDDARTSLSVLNKEPNAFLREIVYPTSSLNKNWFHPMKSEVSYAHRARQVALTISLGKDFKWDRSSEDGSRPLLVQTISGDRFRSMFLSCTEHKNHEIAIARIELASLNTSNFPSNNSYTMQLNTVERDVLASPRSNVHEKSWLRTGLREFAVYSASPGEIHETKGISWHGSVFKMDSNVTCYECSPSLCISRLEWHRNLLSRFESCTIRFDRDECFYIPCVLKEAESNRVIYPNLLSHYLFQNELEFFKRHDNPYEMTYIKVIEGRHCYRLTPKEFHMLIDTVATIYSNDHDIILSEKNDITFSITPRDPAAWFSYLQSAAYRNISVFSSIQLNVRFIVTAVIV